MKSNPLAFLSGELRSVIQIQSQTTVQDSFGEKQQTWNTVATAQAKITTVTERELDQANQLASQVSHVIQFRWIAPVIAPGMQVICGSSTYKIQAADNVEKRNQRIKLLCLAINESA